MATNNRDLLKEAIADAKAVKETAIANAKAALTESFTPFLQEKLSQKISEMEENNIMDEDVYNEEEQNEDLNEISLDELLAELEESPKEMEEELYEAKKDEKDEEMSLEDMSEDDLKSFIEDVIKDMVANKELEVGDMKSEDDEEMPEDDEEMPKDDEEMPEDDEEMPEDDEDVNLEELLAEIEENEINEAKRKKKKKEEEKEELEEAYKAIKILKYELNEINLLNSKLLYTNKIFRSKSLTESQKIKVLTAFDKAKTKQEAKLVYETLQEGLKVSTIKSPIKESLSSASKFLGSVASKPIIENDAFARMRELAGLKK